MTVQADAGDVFGSFSVPVGPQIPAVGSEVEWYADSIPVGGWAQTCNEQGIVFKVLEIVTPIAPDRSAQLRLAVWPSGMPANAAEVQQKGQNAVYRVPMVPPGQLESKPMVVRYLGVPPELDPFAPPAAQPAVISTPAPVPAPAVPTVATPEAPAGSPAAVAPVPPVPVPPIPATAVATNETAAPAPAPVPAAAPAPTPAAEVPQAVMTPEGRCAKHPTYGGQRKPGHPDCPGCLEVYKMNNPAAYTKFMGETAPQPAAAPATPVAAPAGPVGEVPAPAPPPTHAPSMTVKVTTVSGEQVEVAISEIGRAFSWITQTAYAAAIGAQ